MPVESSAESTPTPLPDAIGTAADARGEIVAYAGSWYRNARYIMAAIVFACAAWFAYDGWVGYPKINAAYQAAIERKEKPAEDRKSDLDIQIQKLLAITLPIVGVLIIVWLRYNSRGCYRLKGDVLQVPGHPPVPLDAIREIDKSKWDKKGIAYLDYELAGGGGKPKTGTITLDDFVYQQEPTDAILAAIEARVAPEEQTAEEQTAGEPTAEAHDADVA